MFENIKNIFNKKNIVSNNKRILVVEDNGVDRKLIVNVLEKAGYKIIEAVNGREGLDKAKEQKPDLIVLDCEMPLMKGHEVCRELKEIEDTMHIPVIFLTSVNTPGNIMDCFEAEAENFLAKPIKPKVLIQHVNEIFKVNV